MKYLKLYEEFKYENDVVEIDTIEKENDISNKTIDDVLKDDFFEHEDDSLVTRDERGVYNIKGWDTY